jgi:hypothetical protein
MRIVEGEMKKTVIFILMFLLMTSLASAAGRLDINSQPKDAKVFVNDKFVGFAPMLLTGVPSGNHVIEVKKEGYLPYKRDIYVPDKKTVAISVELLKKRHASAAARRNVRVRNSILGAAVVNEIVNDDDQDNRNDVRRGLLGAGLLNHVINK